MSHHAVAHVQLCLRGMRTSDTLHLRRTPATVDGLVAVAAAGVNQAFVHGWADTERELVLNTGTRVGSSLARRPGLAGAAQSPQTPILGVDCPTDGTAARG